MKKLTALSVALTMLLSFTACNSDTGSSSAEADVSTTAKAETVKDETTNAKSDETTVPEETTTEVTTTEPVVEASPVEDFEYEETGGEIVITKYKGSEAEVIIPAEIDDKPVTTIGNSAFVGCSNVTDITIPDSVTEIRANPYDYWSPFPFEGTAWLKKKKEENPLVVVGKFLIDARECSRSVEIPEGVTVIADGAFYECTTVTSVTLPKGLERIGRNAFQGCERLTEIILPDSVNYIGDCAFYYCKALENVTFPNNTVEMGISIFDVDYQLNPIPWLEKKQAENPLVIINDNLIDGRKCSGDVVIPNSIKSIAGSAFQASKITGIQLPEGITKIPDYIFCGCDSLTSVNIPDSVMSIGAGAFSWCASLTSITIPNNVTEIGSTAFYCTSLKSITIPNSVTKIGDKAFAGDYCYCTFESITIPGSVTEIGDEAFSKCKNLKSVTLSEGLKKFGENVFQDTKITELTLPDSLESISTSAFGYDKPDITYKGEIYFPELYDELYAAINGN